MLVSRWGSYPAARALYPTLHEFDASSAFSLTIRLSSDRDGGSVTCWRPLISDPWNDLAPVYIHASCRFRFSGRSRANQQSVSRGQSNDSFGGHSPFVLLTICPSQSQDAEFYRFACLVPVAVSGAPAANGLVPRQRSAAACYELRKQRSAEPVEPAGIKKMGGGSGRIRAWSRRNRWFDVESRLCVLVRLCTTGSRCFVS